MDWDEVYLVGYWRGGTPHLTAWDGPPTKDFVVFGCDQPPIWNARVPSGATVELIPEGEDPRQYAESRGGVHAVGWVVPKRDRAAEKP